MYQKDIKVLSTCLFNKTMRTVKKQKNRVSYASFFNTLVVKYHYLQKKNCTTSQISCIIEFFFNVIHKWMFPLNVVFQMSVSSGKKEGRSFVGRDY